MRGEEALALAVTLDFPTPDSAEFAARMGATHVVIDLEHASGQHIELNDFARACEVGGAVPVVRTPYRQETLLAAVDSGITCIELTGIRNRDEVESAAATVSFAPRGHRGIGRTRQNVFGHPTQGSYERLVADLGASGVEFVIHIETVSAVRSVEEIAAASGVSTMLVGRADLAADAGYPGQPHAEEVRRLAEHAVAAIVSSGKRLGWSASLPEDVEEARLHNASFLLASQSRLISTALHRLANVAFAGVRS